MMKRVKDAGTTAHAIVCVVDDDVSVRDALPALLGQFGFTAHAFASAEEFLSSDQADSADCLILDVAMPGMSGPDLHAKLKCRGIHGPVIFITAHADPLLPARLMREGAAACLSKPFSDTVLLDTLNAALAAT